MHGREPAPEPAPGEQRAWWLRALLVLQSPRAVFVALRDDGEPASSARQEPATALIYLAGIAGVLSTGAARRLLDDFAFDSLVVAVWAIFAGGIYAFAVYWLGGGLVHVAERALGAQGSYRRTRHLLAFAAAPLALSLVAVWPLELALFGGDVFRSGGSEAGAAGDVLRWLERAFAVWALGLLAVGLRVVHGWSWLRSVAAFALAVAVPVAAVVLAELAESLPA